VHVLLKKTLNTTVAVSIFAALMPPEAQAGCAAAASAGSGPPSISATEVSTSQALQLIRKRRDEAIAGGGGNAPIQVAQNLPAPPAAPVQAAPKPAPVVQAPAPKPVTAPVAQAPAAKPATPPVAQVPAPKPAPTAAPVIAKAKKPATVVAVKKSPQKPIVLAEKPAATVRVRSYQPSLKDDIIEFAPEPTRATWAQVYADYEYHSGWTLDGGTRGELTSRQYTAGAVTGADWLVRGSASGTSKLLVGVLGGISSTKTDYNDVKYSEQASDSNNPNTRALFQRSEAEEHIEGGGGGVYAVLASNRFSADAMIKVDGYNLEQTDTVALLRSFDITDPLSFNDCGGPPVGRKGSTDFAMFTLTSNVAYRYDLGSQSYFEPTAGIRYTHVSYGNQSGSLPLGLVDGDSLRLQAGGRVGTVRELPDGKIVVATLGAMLYSDVIVDGFSKVNSAGFNTAEIDEGKLRVMGQFATYLIAGNGFTYSLQADVRGGEDVFGVGGKLGVRYEW